MIVGEVRIVGARWAWRRMRLQVLVTVDDGLVHAVEVGDLLRVHGLPR